MVTIKKKGYAAKKQSEQEILTLAHSVSAFINKNGKVITIILSVLAALLVVWGGYSVKVSMDEKKAGPLLSRAYSFYNPAAGSLPDYAKAADLFREVREKYPSTKSGSIAAYYAGNALANLNRNEEALKEYQSFVERHGSDTLLRGLAYARMGYAYREMGKQAEAIQSFEQADALTGPGIATVELARLYESSGKSAESQRKYKIIAEKLAGTQWALEAMGKVEKIEPAPSAGKGE